ncbi:MAG TPA: transglutaminaseTgpA domain-containing protein, partial [Acidimicrobiales bacterium]|nr:transglutaminaseTgpA domain-containing protein [Acidimicrobiales bacterium]
AHEQELSGQTALLAAIAVLVGVFFSHWARNRNNNLVKVLVAAAATTALGVFLDRLYQLSGSGGGLATVESPLTVLLCSILVVHSFHVPARRDLLFSLASSGALMAVSAAAAVDMRFAVYAVGWTLVTIWALFECGTSAAGGVRPPLGQVGTATGATLLIALAVFLVLPAPNPNVRLDFQTNPGSAGPVAHPGLLAGDAGQPTQLSRPGSPSGRTGVGGYLGFAGALDTADRASLGHEVVMQVRATIPTFWVGETYNRWDGQSWSSTLGTSVALPNGSPFTLPYSPALGGAARMDVQTFYIDAPSANLVFHADSPTEVWFPASQINQGPDGSIISPIGIGKGAIYTVESAVVQPSPADLRISGDLSAIPQSIRNENTALPRSYDEVHQLAAQITAGETSSYDKIESLINWIGQNTQYSLDIPPLPRGADAVDQFLFKSRAGYCEQISTALTVMLRTLGIPAREAVGYVPGSYNPLTDLYEVRADDAHAWVQVWFPGFGWQDFDPTAVVPDANPSPGLVALKDVAHLVAALPWRVIGWPVGAVPAMAAAVVLFRRRQAFARLSPAERAVARMEKAGRRAGRPRRPAETVREYASALHGTWPEVAEAVEASHYGGLDVTGVEWDRLLRMAEGVKQ